MRRDGLSLNDCTCATHRPSAACFRYAALISSSVAPGETPRILSGSAYRNMFNSWTINWRNNMHQPCTKTVWKDLYGSRSSKLLDDDAAKERKAGVAVLCLRGKSHVALGRSCCTTQAWAVTCMASQSDGLVRGMPQTWSLMS